MMRLHDAGLQGTEHLLRYLSLHDNQYVRYFRGHTARVTGITMSPKNDLFMSAAEVSIYVVRIRPHILDLTAEVTLSA